MRVNREVWLDFSSLARVVDLEGVFVWGSATRTRRGTGSDIDLILVSPSFRSLVQFARKIIARRYLKSSHPIDALCLTPEELSLIELQERARPSELSRRKRLEWK